MQPLTKRQMQKPLSIQFFWSVLKSNPPLLLVFIIAGALAGVLSCAVITDQYRTTATIMIWPRDVAPENGISEDNSRLTTAFYHQMVARNYFISDCLVLLGSENFRTETRQYLADSGLANIPFKVRPALLGDRRSLTVSVSSPKPEVAYNATNKLLALLTDYVETNLPLYRVLPTSIPALPTQPYAPLLWKHILYGLVIGMFIGYALLLFKRLFHDKIDSPEKVAENLNMVRIGTIIDLGNDLTDGDVIVTNDADGKSSHRFSGDEFRMLRTDLQYAFPRQDGAVVLAITSSASGDGKSFISSNLAAIMAQTGKKILLVNADLRKSAKRGIFHETGGRGLVNILVGENSFDEVVCRGIRETTMDVLGNGALPPNPAELLLSEEFTKLMQQLRTQYDYVILDTPPSSQVAEAIVACKASDGVILVVNCRQTKMELAQNTINHLLRLNIPLLGVVLNRYRPTQWLRSYSRYGYGYEESASK